jgi:hypothetical protein
LLSIQLVPLHRELSLDKMSTSGGAVDKLALQLPNAAGGTGGAFEKASNQGVLGGTAGFYSDSSDDGDSDEDSDSVGGLYKL